MPSLDLATTAEAVVRTASIMDSTDLAVIATDNTGTILYWNTHAESLFGWRSDEAVNRNVVDVTPGQQSAAEAANIMRELLAGRPWSGTFLVRHRDGTPLVVHVTDIPVLVDGSVAGIVGFSKRV
ncbi:MAG: PAS domain-containing protein [Gemmatimonadaceae bacterium]